MSPVVSSLRVLILSLQQQGEVEHCISVAGGDLQCFAQTFDGGFGASLLVKEVAEIVQGLREGRINPRRGPQCCFGFDITAMGPEHVSEIERRRSITWIAFHQNSVEALSFGSISNLLSRLRLRKQVVGIVLKLADRKEKLAVFVSTSLNPALFSAVGNYLILRVTEMDARILARMAGSSDQERRIADRLKGLERYTGLFFGEGRSRPTTISLQDDSTIGMTTRLSA
jgi:hypothetical protein